MREPQVYIPPRFQDEIRSHLVLNYAEHANYPLILGIFGPPGNGKTFQLRLTLREMGVSVRSVSAADLESERAGEPGKLVAMTYLMASREIGKGNPTAIVIDDFDTTVGEWVHNTGTVNHQQVIAQVMHLADSPTQLEKVGIVRRVPVFLTGNDFSKLYPPLRRPGRMFSFYWSPTNGETEAIMARILDFVSADVRRRLLASNPSAPISFFTEIRVRLLRESCAQLMKRIGNDVEAVVRDPSRFRKYTLASFNTGAIEPSRVLSIAQDIVEVTEAVNEAHLQVYKS